MAVTPTPAFPQTINTGLVTIVNADAQALKTILTAGANGAQIDAISVSSSDTSNRDVAFYVTRSGTDYLISTVSVLLGAGVTNSVPAIDVLRHAQLPGMVYSENSGRRLLLKAGDVLKCNAPVTITAAKTITVLAQGKDF